MAKAGSYYTPDSFDTRNLKELRAVGRDYETFHNQTADRISAISADREEMIASLEQPEYDDESQSGSSLDSYQVCSYQIHRYYINYLIN